MKNLLLSFVLLMISSALFAQGVKISTNPGSPDVSSMVEIESTSKGFLPPRMTTLQRNAIENPAPGLRIYNTDSGCENFFSGTTNNWMELCGVCPGPATPTEGAHIPSVDEIVWNWNVVPGAVGYKWSTTNNYAAAIDVNAATTYTQTGLSASTSYTLYVWAYNACGVSAAPAELISTTTAPPCTVGLIGPGGGRIFYCGSAYPGYIGLEAAPSDQSTGAVWGCNGTAISGADDASIGAGNQSTIDIMNGCGTAGIAARICGDLVLSGFSDWFLPSINELGLMYSSLHQQGGLGGFSSADYWSSTENNSTTAWFFGFGGGSTNGYNIGSKTPAYRVRAVRRF